MKLKKCLKIKLKHEKPNKILEIAKGILDFNKKNSNRTGFGSKNTNPQTKCLVDYQLL